MNKAELIEAMGKANKLSKSENAAALNAFVDVVTKELRKGEKVQLVGFGTFVVGARAARTVRNPRTGEEFKLKASKMPRFKAGKGLKSAVNK